MKKIIIKLKYLGKILHIETFYCYHYDIITEYNKIQILYNKNKTSFLLDYMKEFITENIDLEIRIINVKEK